MTEEKKE